MTNQEIYDLISCFDRSTAQTMRLSTQDFSLELTRGGAAPAPSPAVPAAPIVSAAPAPAPAGSTVTAPLVGTFYAAPAPEKPPFVRAGAIAILSLPENRGKIALFGGVKNARFKRQVIPGDVLEMECVLTKRRGPVGIGQCRATVNGETACTAELIFAVQAG